MASMTDEEAARLDAKWTETPPKPGANGTGYFTRCKQAVAERGIVHTITIDSVTASYLSVKAAADCKTPAEVISDMVCERITAAAKA
jgi:hypothetical protein